MLQQVAAESEATEEMAPADSEDSAQKDCDMGTLVQAEQQQSTTEEPSDALKTNSTAEPAYLSSPPRMVSDTVMTSSSTTLKWT